MYWINTISHDHVLIGVQGGFTQAGHGKSSGLKKLAKGDFIVFYSPKTSLKDGKPLQKFTAIGQITDTQPYQVEMNPSFHPWRRNVKFFSCKPVAIRPLIDKLEFIKDKQHWGYMFRFGLFSIERGDFELIAVSMKAELKAI
jgi:hypothetical protein